MATGELSNEQRNPYVFLLVLAAMLAAMVCQSLTLNNRVQIWAINLVLLTAFAVVTGRAITGYWRGIFIDSRYRMSLSRLQMLTWMLIVLSAFFTAAITNLEYGSSAISLDIDIPTQILALMGISTASLIASPAVLSSKRAKKADQNELQRAVDAMQTQGHTEVDCDHEGLVVRNRTPAGARWSDLLKGEEVGNASTVDLGKLQMFFFTFVLAGAYATAIAAMFRLDDLVTSLPAVEDGMITLLGISHTGYLANKALPHSQEEQEKDRDQEEQEREETRKPPARKKTTRKT